jgi:hypothetical protein
MSKTRTYLYQNPPNLFLTQKINIHLKMTILGPISIELQMFYLPDEASALANLLPMLGDFRKV